MELTCDHPMCGLVFGNAGALGRHRKSHPSLLPVTAPPGPRPQPTAASADDGGAGSDDGGAFSLSGGHHSDPPPDGGDYGFFNLGGTLAGALRLRTPCAVPY